MPPLLKGLFAFMWMDVLRAYMYVHHMFQPLPPFLFIVFFFNIYFYFLCMRVLPACM